MSPFVTIFSMLWTRVNRFHCMWIFELPRRVNQFSFLLAVIFPKTGSTMPIRFE